jgi:hypothetical protein
MFINPDISGRLAKDRRQDLLAGAGKQRLIRQVRAARVRSLHIAAPRQRVRTWVMNAVARLSSAASA